MIYFGLKKKKTKKPQLKTIELKIAFFILDGFRRAQLSLYIDYLITKNKV